MSKVRIAGAIAGANGITLYLADGGEVNLPAEAWRTKRIADKITPRLARGEIVSIDLDDYSAEKELEKKSNGLVRFFRRLVGGNDPSKSNETLVAVVDGVEVKGLEAIERHIEHAAYSTDGKAMQAFIKRLAGIIDQRGHTVGELLNFMRRGDLPIADDGSIIAYKILRKKGDSGYFVDCYTGKVPQRLGSHVSMAESLVDPSRRYECSNGLHVARRGYLGRFSGDVITIIKVNPEDVIAVPENEPDKMRVAAYHIVAILPEEARQLLVRNQSMTSLVEASKILADVIAGNHIGIVERVVIGAHRGENVTVTTYDGVVPPKKFTSGEAKTVDDPAPKVTPKDLRKMVDEAKPAAAPTKKGRPKPWETKKAQKLLSDKQRQALTLLHDGMTMRAVCKEVGISHHTVNKAQELLGIRK